MYQYFIMMNNTISQILNYFAMKAKTFSNSL